MSFTKKVKLYFDQADPGGVAFHGQHSNMAQRVFEDYLPTLGISWEEWFANTELFFPVVQLNIKYTKPLFPGKEYLIQMDFTYMGRSSLHGSYKIFNMKQRALLLFVCGVCVCQQDTISIPSLSGKIGHTFKARYKTHCHF